MSYRDRRLARAERLREWAQKRQDRAAATLASHEVYRGDHAFNFQPGHIPLRARVITQDDAAYASLSKAAGMESRAGSIEAQLDRAIYTDDPDAVTALAARIASLEAERDRIKAYNVSCRRGAPDPALLDEDQRASLASSERFEATYQARKKHQMPSYALANLNGNIKRNRDRLAALIRASA